MGLLDEHGTVTVAELSGKFGVSEMTVRRDLLELEHSGVLRRIHGGATRAMGRAFEPPYRARETRALGAKRAIARKAVEFISEGDAIGLDIGSTVLEMVGLFVPIDNLTVVTAGMRIANRVSELHQLERSIRLIVTGGITRADELSFVGAMAIDVMRSIRLDTCFLSAGGFSATGGLTEFNLEDAEVKKAMIESSRRVVVLVDSSKFAQTGFAHVMDVERAFAVISDTGLDDENARALQERGVEVHLVEPE